MLLNAYALNEVVPNGDSEQISGVTSVVLNAVFGEITVVVTCPVDSTPVAHTIFPEIIVYPIAIFNGTSYQAPSLGAIAQIGVPSASYKLEFPVDSFQAATVFGSVATTTISNVADGLDLLAVGGADAASISFGGAGLTSQVMFGGAVVAVVHDVGLWYAGAKFGAVVVESLAEFSVLDGLDPVEIGVPYLGATIHRAIPLHMMPTFGPVTIHRSHTC